MSNGLGGAAVAQRDAGDAGLIRAVMAHPLRIAAWLRRHPLVACLPIQAVLLFADLGRLPVWGDEQSSLARAALPLDALVAALRHNVHPPLYFLLLHGWLSAFCGGPGSVAARALSALFLLTATAAIDRCWLRGLGQRGRTWFLILWTLSPALLLYGRMARSYSLQVLLACLALYAGRRSVQRATLPVLLAYVAAATALLYTHYLPGLAVIAGVASAMAWRAVVRHESAAWRSLVASLLGIGVAFAPWLPFFTGAVARVADADGYHVIGRFSDVALALAFTFASFSVGESLPPWMIAALLVLSPGLAVVLWRALREPPAWLAVVAPAAVIGFLGAYQWVSSVFVAARLVFLLPFYLLLLVHGARGRARLGTVVCTALAVVSLGGIACYFGQIGFLNKAYVVPTEAIADAIRAGSPDQPVTVILDHHSIDLSAVAARLPRQARILRVTDPVSAAAAARLSAEPGLHLVWFLHAAHDVSPQHWNTLVEDAFATRFSIRRTAFVPYSALDRWLMRAAGWTEQPGHAVELAEMRSAGEGP